MDCLALYVVHAIILICRADLLVDVDDEHNSRSLHAALQDLDPSDSIRTVVNTCLRADQRIMKARVLRVSNTVGMGQWWSG